MSRPKYLLILLDNLLINQFVASTRVKCVLRHLLLICFCTFG